MGSSDFNLKLGRGNCIPLLMGIYLLYLFLCTLSPLTFSIDPSLSLFSLYVEKFDAFSAFRHFSAWDVLSNVMLFVPFGFFFAALPTISHGPLVKKIILPTICACAVSFGIETCQLFLPRSPSMGDVFLNTVGGMTGSLISIYFYAPLSRIAYRCFLGAQRSRHFSILVPVYVILFLSMISIPLPIRPDFSNWDPDYSFQLGNEATLDRPWLGKIFLVAIYNRDLLQNEIINNFNVGPFAPTTQRQVQKGLVAFYDFREGAGTTVHDRADVGIPFDLWIRDSEHIKWLRPNGIEILEKTIVAGSKISPQFYYSNLSGRRELTLEVWIAPTDIHQKGPARIVSYSQDTGFRNFTLGQTEANIVFRLRTPLSGLNGAKPQLKTEDSPLTTSLQHLVVTYHHGIETLYVNGKEHETRDLNRKIFFLEMIEYPFGGKYKWTFWFPVIFPMGFFSYLLFSSIKNLRGNAGLLSGLMGLIFLVAIEGLQAVPPNREVGLSLLPGGTLVLFISILTSAVLSRNVQVP